MYLSRCHTIFCQSKFIQNDDSPYNNRSSNRIYIFLCHVHAFRIKRHCARVYDLSSNILQRQIVTFITIIANFLAFQSIQCCSIIIIIVVINIIDDNSDDAVAVVAATPIDHPLFHIYCVNLTFGILIQLRITFKRSWRTDLQIDLWFNECVRARSFFAVDATVTNPLYHLLCMHVKTCENIWRL